MKDVTLSVAVTEVTLAADGAGSVTVSLTVGGAAAERIVLTAIGAVPATIDRPLREVRAEQTEQFVAAFDGRAAQPGRYPVKFVGYPSDEAPEEYADRGQVVQVVVPQRPVPPPRRPIGWLPVAVAAAVLLVVVLVAVVLTRPDAGPGPDDGSGQTATTPVRLRVDDVTALPAAQATARLEAQGLRVTVVTAQSDLPVGTVVDQAPAAGTVAAAGDAVTITVAVPRLVPVPDVVGLTPEQAADRLTTAGLRATGRGRCRPPLGGCVVVAQTPAAAERVPVGSQVLLRVLLG